ncbi:MAG: 50S ribosomal protein L3 [Acidobacteriota bacterium]|nr:50S ribosomal protein L3 [Acidobacteriota bacterium]
MPAILATKLGMTQRFMEDGSVERVTVLEAGPCPVTALRTAERDGYEAVQLAFGATTEKRLSKAERGHLARAGVGPMRHLVELRGELEGVQVGESVTVDRFQVGERVKVAGISKGKGFQGTIARHGFKRGPKTHGSHNVRGPGSIGAAATPSRVFKGVRMAGHGGARRATQRGLRVIAIEPERNLLLLRGAVPGARGGLVEVRGDA